MPDGSPSGQLTIAELAAKTGVSVRTIRYYTGLGLIPPPEVRGRLGLYDDRHVARLELVRQMQTVGFTLAAIEGYLARIPPDRSPEDLALNRALLAPWLPEEPEPIDRAELDRRAGRPISDQHLDQLVALGVLQAADHDTVLLVNQEMLDYGLDMLDSEIDLEIQLASKQIIEQHTLALATDLVSHFGRCVLREYKQRGHPPEMRKHLLSMLDRVKPVTLHSVLTNFQLAVNRAIRESIPDHRTSTDADPDGRAGSDSQLPPTGS